MKIVNGSLKETRIPQNWRNGKIIPILKNGKPPEAIPSYRPICLTSCVGKLMERVINKRIMYKLESRNMLNENQAGFRSSRSVEDQLIRLSQTISDGFQDREKTTLALLDYAKAYDKVWRDGLLLKMIDMGVGESVVRWIQCWLSNRKAWVEFEGEKTKTFR